MSLLVIDGHPDPGSFGAALARTYADAAAASGAEVHLLAVRDLDFDPVLHHGYRRRQPLEPDLEAAWARLVAATHVVVVAPVWWGSVPVPLKGLFDRMLLPGRAFETLPNGLPRGLLRGRTARVVVTSDSPVWYLRLFRDSTVAQLRDSVLRYCGLRVVGTARLGPVRTAAENRRRAWLEQVAATARRDAARAARRRTPRPTPAPAS